MSGGAGLTSRGVGKPGGRGKNKGKGTSEGRNVPKGQLRALPLADLAELLPVGPPRREHHSDQSILDGWNDHLDDDRYVDPPSFDPVDRPSTDLVGNRGRVVLELYCLDGKVRHRVLDDPGSDSVAARNPFSAEHLRLLDELGRILAEHNYNAVMARSDRDGRALMQPLSGWTVEELTQDSEVRVGHDWVSRTQTDFVVFPWGTVPLSDLVREKKGTVDVDQIVQGWALVNAELAEHGYPLTNLPRGAKADLIRDLQDATGLSEQSAKRLVNTVCVLVRDAELIWGIAASAVDAFHLRAALQARGIELAENQQYILALIAQGRLAHPDDLEPPT